MVEITRNDGVEEIVSPAILRACNRMMNDPTFSGRDKFTTIAPLGWQDSVALQPADLVAFECYKEAEGDLQHENPRKLLRALLHMSNFGINSKTVNKESLLKLREILENAKQRNARSLDGPVTTPSVLQLSQEC